MALNNEQAAQDDATNVDDVDKFDDTALDTSANEQPADDSDAAADTSTDETDGVSTDDAEEGTVAEGTDDTAGKADEETVTEEKPDYMMPKSRYDFQKSMRDQAEQRASDLETQNVALLYRVQAIEAQQTKVVEDAQEAQTDKIGGLEDKIATLDAETEQFRLDGKAKEAAEKQGEIRRLERQIIKLENAPAEMPSADDIRNAALTQMRNENALEKVISTMESDHPQLKEGDESYDADAVEEVLDLYGAMVKQGKSPAVAMERAVGYVVGVPTGQPAAQKSTARKEEAVKRNLKAAKKQPPDTDGVGLDSDKAGAKQSMDVMHMSIEEYESLGVDEDKFLS